MNATKLIEAVEQTVREAVPLVAERAGENNPAYANALAVQDQAIVLHGPTACAAELAQPFLRPALLEARAYIRARLQERAGRA